MPFADGFEDIDQIIAEAAQECGLEYVRGDRRLQPGSILPQILHAIRHAAVGDLRELIQQFDRLFDDSRSEMSRTHPPDGRLAEQLRGFYDEAMAVVNRRVRDG